MTWTLGVTPMAFFIFCAIFLGVAALLAFIIETIRDME